MTLAVFIYQLLWAIPGRTPTEASQTPDTLLLIRNAWKNLRLDPWFSEIMFNI